jgi:hypothetical protein
LHTILRQQKDLPCKIHVTFASAIIKATRFVATRRSWRYRAPTLDRKNAILLTGVVWLANQSGGYSIFIIP